MAAKNVLVRGVVCHSGESKDKKSGEVKLFTHVFVKNEENVRYSGSVVVEGVVIQEGNFVVLEVENVEGVKEGRPWGFNRYLHNFTDLLKDAGNGKTKQREAGKVGV